MWAASDYKKGGNDPVEYDEKEVRAKALLKGDVPMLLKPCKVCGKAPTLIRDLYGMGDSMIFYVCCDGGNHGRPRRLYTCAEDAIKGWNARGGE